MLRRTSALSRGLITWMGQIAASLAATAVASMIYAALPKLTPADPPTVALTSGGKFAARIPGAAETADLASLSTQPRRLLLPAITDIAMPGLTPSSGGAEWDQTLATAPAVGPAPPLTRMPTQPGKAPRPMHADARHGGDAARADPRRGSAPATAPASGAEPIGGVPKTLANMAGTGPLDAAALVHGAAALMPKVLESAQSAWTMTASAGTSLLSRLAP